MALPADVDALIKSAGSGSAGQNAAVVELLARLVVGLAPPGVFAYDSGVAAQAVSPPPGARLYRVAVVPADGDAGVAFGGGPVVVVPAGTIFNELVPVDMAATDVHVTGVVASWYVSWVL